MAGASTLSFTVSSGIAPSINLAGQGGMRTLSFSVSSGVAPSIQLPVPFTVDVTVFNQSDDRKALSAITTDAEVISAITAFHENFGIVGSIGRIKRSRVKTSDYTMTMYDENIVCFKTSSMIVTLLSATGSGRFHTIDNSGTAPVYLKCAGSDTISGSSVIEIEAKGSISIIDSESGKWIITNAN